MDPSFENKDAAAAEVFGFKAFTTCWTRVCIMTMMNTVFENHLKSLILTTLRAKQATFIFIFIFIKTDLTKGGKYAFIFAFIG